MSPTPTLTIRDEHSREIHEWLLPDGTLHNADGPARIVKLWDQVESEAWVQNGEYFRSDGGPTMIAYRISPRTSELTSEESTYSHFWMVGPHEFPIPAKPSERKSQRHRIGGPAVVHYFGTGAVMSEAWWQDGRHHRVDGPAQSTYDIEGQLLQSSWYTNGLVGGPDGREGAWFESHPNGSQKREMWFADGELHRRDGPAFTEWFEDGSLKSIEYYEDGRMTRRDGPASVEFYPASGEGRASRSEQWREDDRLHRPDGPAFVRFCPDGRIAEQQWWFQGARRTEGGPAIIRTSDDGQTTLVDWNDVLGAAATPESTYLGIDYTARPGDHDPSEEGVPSLLKRRWHRWLLGLEKAPDDAPFTLSWWLHHADLDEVDSRLQYFPHGNAMARRVLRWRAESRAVPDQDPATVARQFAVLVRNFLPSEDLRALLDSALAHKATIVDTAPKPEDGEYNLWELNDIGDSISVCRLLHESIYNASGNWFAPIYWITEPIHGVEVQAWLDYERLNRWVVVGADRFVIAPR